VRNDCQDNIASVPPGAALKPGSGTKVEVSAEDLELILDGVEVFRRHKELNFESVS
jgi:hypothetical protein